MTTLPSAVKRCLWPAVCLFQLGLIAGLYRVSGRPRPTVAPAPSAVTAPPMAERSRELAAAEAIDLSQHARGDAFLSQGRYAQAVAVYEVLAAGTSGSIPAALRYRLALSLEGSGQWERSLAEYRTLASSGAERSIRLAAELGQARLWMRMNKPEEAKPLLCRLILESSLPAPLLADARYFLGLALSMDAPWPEEASVLGPISLVRPSTDWPVERLAWSTLPAGESRPAEATAEDRIRVRPHGSRVDESQVEAAVQETAVADLVHRLAEQAGLKAHWAPSSWQFVKGRSLSVSTQSLPLSLVLTALAEPLGLVWEIRGDGLHLATAAEASPQILATYRIAIAERELAAAVAAYPDHPVRAGACLELGNLAVASGKLDKATSWYEGLLGPGLSSELAIEAQYNLGVLPLRRQDFASARQAFYRVVDRAPGHLLVPAAYLQIGRLYLAEGDHQKAIAPLRRALTLAAGSEAQSEAVVTFAAACLLTDNPESANTVLVEYREAVGEEPYRSWTAFLGAYARYLAPANRIQAKQEGGSLLSALSSLKEGEVLGLVGSLLVGRAYRDLSLGEQMASVYERSLPRASLGPMAAEMTYALAEYQYSVGRGEAAKHAWSVLAASAWGGFWRGRAEQRLAQAAFEERRLQDCLAGCHKLLDGPDIVDRAATLRLMGQAFEQLGDYQKAARCYAGELPGGKAATPTPQGQ